MSQQSTQNHELNQVLGFWDLMGAAVGQIIGAGIMSLTGSAIAMTGKSVPIAFLISTIFVIARMFPFIFINSTVRIAGGPYGMVSLLASPKLGGFYAIVYTMGQLSLASYCLSSADYFMGLIGMGNRMVIAIVVLVLFYVLNLMGVDKFSAIQNFIVAALIIALVVFTIFGLGEVDWANLTADGQWMTDGIMGLLQASALLTFATGGAQIIANLASEAKNPTRDIPVVIIVSTLGVAAVYALMAIVAAGVLPLEQTAGKSLVATARTVLPYPLYVFFIIGGAEGALLSTLNSQLAGATKPMLQATWDGWFPESWGKLNSHKVPYVYLTVLFVIGLLTILTGMNIAYITQLVQIIGSINNFLLCYTMVNLEKILPEEWHASKFYVSQPVMWTLAIIGFASCALTLWLQAKGKPAWLLIANVAMMVVALAYSFARYNSGKVKKEITYSRA